MEINKVIKLILTIQVIGIILKLTDFLSFSWWIVLIPLLATIIIPALLNILILIILKINKLK